MQMTVGWSKVFWKYLVEKYNGALISKTRIMCFGAVLTL